MKKFSLLIVLLVMMNAVTAAPKELTVSNAWIRLMPAIAKNTAAYFTITNPSSKDVQLTEITTSASEKSTLHEMVMEDGMMHMRKMTKVTIPAGESVSFTPGGMHLMLVGLKEKLETDKALNFQFIFAGGKIVNVSMKSFKFDPFKS